MSLRLQQTKAKQAANDPTFITNCLCLAPGFRTDVEQLERYHYCTGKIWPSTNIFKLIGRSPYRLSFPDPIAIIVYRLTVPNMPSRDEATNYYFKKPGSKSENLKLVNRNIRYLARLIVDPRFRRLGLATKIVKESLKLLDDPIVETLMPVDYANNIFVKSGFKAYHNSTPGRYLRLKHKLLSLGLTEQSLTLPRVVQKRIESLDHARAKDIEKSITSFVSHWRHPDKLGPGLERIRFILEKLHYPQTYLIWFNPEIALLP